MLQPPSIPRARMILSEAERSIWYSLSLRVWLGATTMLSPVWTPIASRFSMLQTVMQLSAASRITSYSISFQPRRQRSSSTWLIGEAARPARTMRSRAAAVWAMPPPVPPRVGAGAAGARRQRLAEVGGEAAEEVAVLGAADRLDRRAEDADGVLIEDAGVGEGDGEVKAGLPTESGQET